MRFCKWRKKCPRLRIAGQFEQGIAKQQSDLSIAGSGFKRGTIVFQCLFYAAQLHLSGSKVGASRNQMGIDLQNTLVTGDSSFEITVLLRGESLIEDRFCVGLLGVAQRDSQEEHNSHTHSKLQHT